MGKLEKAPRLKATSTLEKEIDAEVLILSLNTSGTPQEKSSWAQSDTLNLGWFVQHPSVCPHTQPHFPRELLTERHQDAQGDSQHDPDPGVNQPALGFKIIGGKDQGLTVKVGNVKPYSNAEKAGLKTMDYVWEINGKEVFEMSHDQCVAEVKNSGTKLVLATERGDHIVPNFEEIWPSKKGKDGKAKRPTRGIEYYLDAMENGPDLSGYLPIPPNFTTVGKPQITVNQYDSPLDVYSDDTLEEMKEERLVMQNPDLADRMSKAAPQKKSDNPMAAMQARSNGFDPRTSQVLSVLKTVEDVGAPSI